MNNSDLITKIIELETKVVQLESEINRLKEGNFTAEECQNLCHNLQNVTLPVFDAGCKLYQEKLFGKEQCEIYRKRPSPS